MKSTIVLTLISLTLIAAGCNTKNQNSIAEPTSTAVSTNEGNTPAKLGPPPEQSQNEQPPTTPNAYADYSPSTATAAHANGNKVVLFFHAPWCPFCKVADEAFTKRINEIPSMVTILKTDYDSNTELKKKYGVTYQHTFVQVDAEGNTITKWNGGDIDSLKKYLK